ncbi:MAG TPA: aldehyde dehydrogenase family protein, partial [Mycobacterium sp.]|nr:aldehyde dehydrogenase family protein [Mycobacterium sp.]
MDTTTLLKSVPTGLWIGGEEREGSSTFNVLDPSDDQVLTTVADATPDDAIAALDAAVAVQAEWAATAPRERGEILRAVFEKISERADDIATVMTLEMGKVLPESKSEVKYGGEFFRWFSEEAVRIAGRYTPAPAGNGRVLVTKQPVGPCYAITPWNFPLAMGTRKIGPAVAAGCTMIVKPAQETPLTMLLLAKLMDEAGLPKGVLSVLPTTSPGDVTTALIDDGRLRKLTFTGSTGVGKALVKQSSDKLLRTSMELGGNAPFVVFDDADVDAAVDGAILAKMRNGGEACTAANRFHVANAVREEFTEK